MSECVVRMEMPAEHCMDCRYMVSRDNDDCILQSDEANERAESWEDLKAGCPIVAVLPENHGRLVDADALYKKRYIVEPGDILASITVVDACYISGAQTIVPAEEESPSPKPTDPLPIRGVEYVPTEVDVQTGTVTYELRERSETCLD